MDRVMRFLFDNFSLITEFTFKLADTTEKDAGMESIVNSKEQNNELSCVRSYIYLRDAIREFETDSI